MSTCPHRRAVSPENPAFPWCARHRVNLDRAGRLCGRCRNDPVWRERFALQYAVRCRVDRHWRNNPEPGTSTTDADAGAASNGDVDAKARASRSDATEPVFYCGRYDTVADARLCRRCRADPELRAWMSGQAAARRAGPPPAARGAALAALDDGLSSSPSASSGAGRGRRMESCAHRGEFLREEAVLCCGGTRRRLPLHRCALGGEAHEARCALCEEWTFIRRPGQ